MKLIEYKEVQGTIKCLTGLKIGGTKDSLGIGETDNPIIRHPITRLPYIPGSSMKGKIRSLLELRYSEVSQRTGLVCFCGNCTICSMFGHGLPKKSDVSNYERKYDVGIKPIDEPTRLIFRDAFLTEESENELKETLPGSFVEVKTEIAMDRKTGNAARGALREQERIPEGMEFGFTMTIRLFEEDEPRSKEFFGMLGEAFELLEDDYLGGNGTRGYGQVEITYFDPEAEEGDEAEVISMSKYLKRLAV
ncbi:MAG: type III-A CRISPR-associated RAMP protein Csm3 [Candidatus Hatepunaea meridiana]|nr:type III-A CRISPR-associated RAMP protein Csm3 [Candidatus Hatepunaea meridiana]